MEKFICFRFLLVKGTVKFSKIEFIGKCERVNNKSIIVVNNICAMEVV